MNVDDLVAALNDMPRESDVYAESDADFFLFDEVELTEDGDVVLTQASLR